MSKLFSTTFSTKRLTEIADDKQEYIAHLTDQSGFIQPLEEKFTGIQSVIKKILYCEQIDIEDADRVVIDSTEFTVKEVRDYKYGGFPHLKVFLTND